MMNDLWKAFLFSERAFNIGQYSLPADHPNFLNFAKIIELIRNSFEINILSKGVKVIFLF